ncbi:unnamed protein product [Schistosoma curassoni]|uniref:Cystatin domain-containing protein n=1 Tax=Schistosoma curassoni TaxID=6186 RepID=A0A183K9K1_9TREM|nr:unnamed protein product [Schistosoma curassoni]
MSKGSNHQKDVNHEKGYASLDPCLFSPLKKLAAHKEPLVHSQIYDHMEQEDKIYDEQVHLKVVVNHLENFYNVTKHKEPSVYVKIFPLTCDMKTKYPY